MARNEVRACILLALGCFCRASFALEDPEEAADGARPHQLPELRVIEPRFSGSSMVFDAPTIRQSHADSLPSFLARYAGIHVDRSSRTGGYSAMYLRGADPSHVVVVINGLRVNDQLSSRGSAVNLNTISLDAIERIEIERGPTSIFEREALAGVVRIYTATRQTNKATGDLGGYSSRGVALQGAAAETIGVSAIWRDDGSGGLHGRTQLRSAAVDYTSTYTSPIRIRVRTTDATLEGAPDDSGGAQYAIIREAETQNHDTIEASAEWNSDLATSGLTVFGKFYEKDGSEMNPGVAPGTRDEFGIPNLTTKQNYQRFEAGVRLSPYEIGAWGSIVGLDVQWETGRLDSIIDLGFPFATSFHLNRRTVNIEGYVTRQYPAMTIEVGLLAEDDGSGKVALNPASRIVVEPKSIPVSVSLSAGRAEKLPSFYALGHPIVGDPSLRSEVVHNVSMDITLEERHGFEGSVSLFTSDYRNLIDFDGGPPPRLVNRDRVAVDGVEVAASQSIGDHSRVFSQIVHQNFQTPGGIALRQRPRTLASVGITHSRAGWTFSGTARWTDERLDSSIPTGDVTLSGYFVIDAAIELRFGAIQTFLSIDNALDRAYQNFIGDISTGRRARVGLSYEF